MEAQRQLILATPNQKIKGRLDYNGPPPELADPPSPTTDLNAALRGMVDRPFLASHRHFEQQKRADRETAHPDIIEFERCMIKRMAKHGVPMFASEVIRSDERQAMLKEQGRSKAGPGQSPHQYGMAVDIVHGVKGWNLNGDQWRLVGHVGKELAIQKGMKLVWGGDWSFYDPAHWEIAGWKAWQDQFPFPRVLKWTPGWKKEHHEALASLKAAQRK